MASLLSKGTAALELLTGLPPPLQQVPKDGVSAMASLLSEGTAALESLTAANGDLQEDEVVEQLPAGLPEDGVTGPPLWAAVRVRRRWGKTFSGIEEGAKEICVCGGGGQELEGRTLSLAIEI